MSQYIVTIVPIAGEELAGPVAQTVVRVDIEHGRPSVKELKMVAPEGAGLNSGATLPYVDFEMLMRAFIPDTVPPAGARVEAAAPARVPAAPVDNATPVEPVAGKTRRVGTAKRTQESQARAAKASFLQTGRAYRRAPDDAALEVAYQETGSITGVAEHFGVPIHTAQGWVSRMRRKHATGAG